jgi:hypothetical protein
MVPISPTAALSSGAPVAERPIALPPEIRSAKMPITSYLNGKRFDPETKRVLSVAFELVCTALRIGASDDDVKQAIADKVIELAKVGERYPDVLCERVLEDIRRPQD